MTGIVVGVDGSEGSAVALGWAVNEGKVRNLPVTAVLAWGLLTQHQAVIGPEFDPDYDKEHAKTALRTYVHEAVGEDQFDRVRLHPVNDLPARGLLAAARDADLLVVGGRGMGGFKTLLLGSVSSQCVHHAPCPVAVIHNGWVPSQNGATQRVVVGIDGSANGQLALDWAATEAKARGSQLVIVHAWQTPSAYGYPYAGIGFDPAPFDQAAHVLLAKAAASVDVAGLPHVPERIAVEGHAPSVVLDQAKDADVVVVGSRGLGGFKGLLLGSATQQIIQHATCPVVVIPPRS